MSNGRRVFQTSETDISPKGGWLGLFDLAVIINPEVPPSLRRTCPEPVGGAGVRKCRRQVGLVTSTTSKPLTDPNFSMNGNLLSVERKGGGHGEVRLAHVVLRSRRDHR